VRGSPYWLAPEVIELEGSSAASDIWSVGCTIIELLSGTPPYFHLGAMAAVFAMVENEHPPLPADRNLSEEAEEFLLSCFVRDPTRRPGAQALLAHAWLCGSEPARTVSRVATIGTIRAFNSTREKLRSSVMDHFSGDIMESAEEPDSLESASESPVTPKVPTDLDTGRRRTGSVPELPDRMSKSASILPFERLGEVSPSRQRTNSDSGSTRRQVHAHVLARTAIAQRSMFELPPVVLARGTEGEYAGGSRVFGITRGSCAAPCDCAHFSYSGIGTDIACVNCGHFPVVHENLGREDSLKSARKKKRSSIATVASRLTGIRSKTLGRKTGRRPSLAVEFPRPAHSLPRRPHTIDHTIESEMAIRDSSTPNPTNATNRIATEPILKTGFLLVMDKPKDKGKKRLCVLTGKRLAIYRPDKNSELVLELNIDEIVDISPESRAVRYKYAFRISTKSALAAEPAEFYFTSLVPSEFASWIVLIDSVCCMITDSSDVQPGHMSWRWKTVTTSADHKHNLLELLYRKNFIGGHIITGDEDWSVKRSGDCTETNANLQFHWDGEFFKGVRARDQTWGGGRWNGIFLTWFVRDVPVKTYLWVASERKYVPVGANGSRIAEIEAVRDTAQWTWSTGSLVCSQRSGQEGQGWGVNGDVASPLVMLLEVLRQERGTRS
jgi:Protein kinase domain/PH domain